MPEQQPRQTQKRSVVKKGLSTFTKAMLAILVVLAVAMAVFVFNAWQQLNRINQLDDTGASDPSIEVLKPSEEITPAPANTQTAAPAEPSAPAADETPAQDTAPQDKPAKADNGTAVLPINTNNADNTPAPAAPAQQQPAPQNKKNGNLDELF